MITKGRFIAEMRNLMKFNDVGFKIDNILGTAITTESALANCLDDYGRLILHCTCGEDCPDDAYEDFWNMAIQDPDMVSSEEIGELYERLIEL